MVNISPERGPWPANSRSGRLLRLLFSKPPHEPEPALHFATLMSADATAPMT